MELVLAITRAVVLVGTVVFAFLAIVFGFVIVLKEYRLLSTFEQLEKFIKLTNNSNLQADAAKGTLTLGRARPGLVLIAIGAVVLVVCQFRPFKYESTTEEGSGGARQADHVERVQFDGSVRPIGDKDDRQRAIENGGTPAADSKKTAPISATKQPQDGVVRTQKPARETGISSELTIDRITVLRNRLLDNWLSATDQLQGKSLEQQQKLLTDKFGEAYAAVERVIQDKPCTFEELAAIAYDDAKYAPLLRVFNPELSKEGNTVPAFAYAIYLRPLDSGSLNFFRKSKISLQIAGASRDEVYATVLEQAEAVMSGDEYLKDPQAFWRRSGGSPHAFVDFYNKSSIRKFALQEYVTEKGDTPELIARIKYGDAKYVKLLEFFNPDKPDLWKDPKAVVPEGQIISVFLLTEF